jgi:hypothetical protein
MRYMRDEAVGENAPSFQLIQYEKVSLEKRSRDAHISIGEPL